MIIVVLLRETGTPKPADVEGKVAVFKPVLVKCCHSLGAIAELVVDGQVFFHLALRDALCVEVLSIQFWQVSIRLEALKQMHTHTHTLLK